MTAKQRGGTGSDLLRAVAADAAPARPALVPQDLRLSNLVRVLQELRSAPTLSRAELARRTGMAVPTVHRLVSDLERNGLVALHELPAQDGRVGRPPAAYGFHSGAGALAAVDVGNETTRVALADLSGQVTTQVSLPTDGTRSGLVRSLTTAVGRLLAQAAVPLVGAGIGIAAVVHPDTGELCNPPLHHEWAGLRLGEELADRLSCEVQVEQDDHLAALAECSTAGTAPGAGTLLVLQIGRGIGVGVALEGRTVRGSLGRFGRIAGWPVTSTTSASRRHLPGTTLGQTLPASGLVAQYALRGGSAVVHDGPTLVQAARDGDRTARAVIAWAGAEIASLLDRLDALIAPDVVVLGGGLSRSFDVLEPAVSRHLAHEVDLRPSLLGERAVTAGAVVIASEHVEHWLTTRLQRA